MLESVGPLAGSKEAFLSDKASSCADAAGQPDQATDPQANNRDR